jgi:hypothetical protein
MKSIFFLQDRGEALDRYDSLLDESKKEANLDGDATPPDQEAELAMAVAKATEQEWVCQSFRCWEVLVFHWSLQLGRGGNMHSSNNKQGIKDNGTISWCCCKHHPCFLAMLLATSLACAVANKIAMHNPAPYKEYKHDVY